MAVTCRWKLGTDNFAVIAFEREPTWNELYRMEQYVRLMRDATPEKWRPAAAPPAHETAATEALAAKTSEQGGENG